MTKYIIGLTGQAGSGKTFAADKLSQKLDFEYIDLDRIGHELLTKDDVINEICKLFGRELLDNNKINRKKLADIVFADQLKLDQLNLIMHPLIKEEAQFKIKSTNHSIILIVGALLDEIKLISICNKIITITPDTKEHQEFLGEKKRVIKHQRNMKFYESNADFVIFNDFRKQFIDKFINLVQNLIQEHSTL